MAYLSDWLEKSGGLYTIKAKVLKEVLIHLKKIVPNREGHGYKNTLPLR